MKISSLVNRIRAKGAYSKRRVEAVAEHSRKVVTASIDAAQDVAAVAIRIIQSAAEVLRVTITDSSVPVKARWRNLKSETVTAMTDAKAELGTAVKAGFQSVNDKLVRVADVTHREQALENKIRRKANKAKNTAARLALQT